MYRPKNRYTFVNVGKMKKIQELQHFGQKNNSVQYTCIVVIEIGFLIVLVSSWKEHSCMKVDTGK